MTFRDQISTALTNVGRRKLRSTLASLGVVVGTLTIVIMVSLASGVRRQINRQFEAIGLSSITVLPPGVRRGFPAETPSTGRRGKLITAADVARWKSMSGVTRVSPEINLPASVELNLKWQTNVQTVRISGGDPMRAMRFEETPEPVAGSLELLESGAIVLSRGTAQAIGISSNNYASLLGQTVETILRTPRGETQSFALKVLGITQERARVVQVSVADRLAMKSWWFNATNLLEREGYDLVTVRAADVTQSHELTQRLRQEGFQVQSLETLVQIANRVVTAITVMFTMVGSVALLVASIGIANTMVMAIYERTREIGILKAMGASRGEIRRMFMIEAGFIGLIGGVFGLLIGWLAGKALNQGIGWYLTYRELPMRGDFFVVTITLALGAIGFATLIGLVAGALPAQRAARLDPLAALRHE
jgi:putative ABC transport system permease protein